jgi:hypothetical protein
MAQVTLSVQQDIDRLLEWLTWQWERLPEVVQEIDRWDLVEQLTFIEEWPLEEQRLKQLERYAEDKALNPVQQIRYARLLDLVTRNRPLIRQLQRS